MPSRPKKRLAELPDMVRLDVVIGTLSTQIPAEWLEDDKKMASVSRKLTVKVDAEIAKTVEKARTEWASLRHAAGRR